MAKHTKAPCGIVNFCWNCGAEMVHPAAGEPRGMMANTESPCGICWGDHNHGDSCPDGLQDDLREFAERIVDRERQPLPDGSCWCRDAWPLPAKLARAYLAIAGESNG